MKKRLKNDTNNSPALIKNDGININFSFYN